MPAGGESIIVGQYTVNWAGVTMGMMVGEDGVPTIRQQTHGKALDNTDRYGRSCIDAVTLGASYMATFTCQEYRAGSLAAFYPWATFGRIGTIGRLAYNLAAPLVLTSVTGTTAFGSPLVLVAAKAILDYNFDGTVLFGPEIRTLKIIQRLYPYDPGDGLGIAAFTTL